MNLRSHQKHTSLVLPDRSWRQVMFFSPGIKAIPLGQAGVAWSKLRLTFSFPDAVEYPLKGVPYFPKKAHLKKFSGICS